MDSNDSNNQNPGTDPPENNSSVQGSPPPVYAVALQHPPHFNSLPSSVFPLESRFQTLLRRGSGGWWLICYESLFRAVFLILSGEIPPSLTLSRELALAVIDDTITMQQWLRDDPAWLPADVSDVSGELDLPEFISNREDSTFSDLLWGQLLTVPTTFFSHVRTSIRRLLSQPTPNFTARTYPRMPIVRDFAALTAVDIVRLRNILDWDDRWGYTHWHHLGWFSTPWMQDILLHALRLSDSVGWFSVFAPTTYELSTNVPLTLQTVSFVLTALVLEIKHYSGAAFNPAGAHNNYITDFQAHMDLILGFLRRVQAGSIDVHEDTIAEMQAGLVALLSLTVDPPL